MENNGQLWKAMENNKGRERDCWIGKRHSVNMFFKYADPGHFCVSRRCERRENNGKQWKTMENHEKP